MKSLLLLIIFLCPSQVFASHIEVPIDKLLTYEHSGKNHFQESGKKQGHGLINGRLISNTGEILTHIEVIISRGKKGGQQDRYVTNTDTTGKFQFKDIPEATYSLSVRAPGFIRINNSVESYFCRVGDFITVTMVKGGVVTGIVKSPSGEPLINVPVRASCIRDLDGKIKPSGARPRERLTDDRGVYRLYGLEPGVYLISAGGGGQPTGNFNKYQENAPIFYPSSTLDTASELRVDAGQEVTGIDINYRDVNGQVISGTISGGITPSFLPNISITLIQAINGSIAATTSVQERLGFAFYGVSDGEYFIIAQTYTNVNEKDATISIPQRIKVKGNNITGLKLMMQYLSSATGRVVLETPIDENFKNCEKEQITTLKDVLILIQREKAKVDEPKSWDLTKATGIPDDEGKFSFARLIPGQYQVNAYLPNDRWFIQSITQLVDKKANEKSLKTDFTTNLSITNLSLKSGDSVDGLIITLSEGAAGFRGRLIIEEKTANKTNFDNIFIYLIPTDKALANNAHRFYLSSLQEKGEFIFSNLAPGKYWLLSRKLTDVEVNEPDLYRTKEGRLLLLKEAEALKTQVELQFCQRIANYTLSMTSTR
jgi:hypothetical protein